MIFFQLVSLSKDYRYEYTNISIGFGASCMNKKAGNGPNTNILQPFIFTVPTFLRCVAAMKFGSTLFCQKMLLFLSLNIVFFFCLFDHEANMCL